MKHGFRKPSLIKSISARTVAKAKKELIQAFECILNEKSSFEKYLELNRLLPLKNVLNQVIQKYFIIKRTSRLCSD